jgi:5-formyltetrahydrofolate cyclo-ligase
MHQPPDVSELKRTLRKEKLRWRKSLSPAEAQEKSLSIAAALKELPEYRRAKAILFYVSSKANEVNTHDLIREALAKHVRVLVPVTDFDNQTLKVAEINAMEELVPVRFGLLEPAGDSVHYTSADDADAIIVPGVVFDRQCRRVGFGGGYYDRLLPRACAPAIALAYEGQLVGEAPVDAHDVPVDIVVTECSIYRASKRRC